jgi:recombinational DNA repair protein RecR
MVRLIDELKKLPGIGSKTAQRLAFYILRSNDEDAEAWRLPCVRSRPACGCVRFVTTSPT